MRQLTSVELWRKLTESGLASQSECRMWATEAAKTLQAGQLSDGLSVLRELLKAGRVTKYQAQVLAGQTAGELQRGSWIILAPVDQQLWQGWFEVRSVSRRDASDGRVGWARWLSLEDLQALQACRPSLAYAEKHAACWAGGLQEVLSVGESEGAVEVVVAPARGALLTDAWKVPQLSSGTKPSSDWSPSVRIVRSLAMSLMPLHSANLPHGRVLPDRVYLNYSDSKDAESPSSQTLLVRDCLCTTTCDLADQPSGLIQQQLGGLQNAHFLAPEFLAPGQHPTVCTDIYSLGCLWWWLLTGESPKRGDADRSIMAAHAKPLPELPQHVKLPLPLKKCLQHALAKNPAARFSNASEFVAALDVACRMAEASSEEEQPAGVIATVVEEATAKDKSTKDSAAVKNMPTAKPAGEQSAAVVTKEPVVAQQASTPRNAATQASIPQASAERASAERADPSTQKATPARAAAIKASPPKAAVAKPTSQVESKRGAQAAGVKSGKVGKAKPLIVQRKETQTHPSPAAAPRSTGKRGRKQNNKWVVPTLAGCGFLIVVLLILKLSGALTPRPEDSPQATRGRYVPPPAVVNAAGENDPREEYYRIVANGDTLWAPPWSPNPLPLDMLPPGGQLLLSLRPADWSADSRLVDLLASLDTEATNGLEQLQQLGGVPWPDVEQLTVGFYSPTTPGGFPRFAARFQLRNAIDVERLQSQWNNATPQPVEGDKLGSWSRDDGWQYLAVREDESSKVSSFSLGPSELMRDAVELSGRAGPLVPPVERLWSVSSRDADVSLLVSPAFLFADGRRLIEVAPPRLRELLRENLANNTRSALVQMQVRDTWYWETQWIGASDREAGQIAERLKQQSKQASGEVEQWFVTETPHPYWRALALRFPQMLRFLHSQSRFGVESGVAIANAYLPPQAFDNILLASWTALQPAATLQGSSVVANDTPSTQPLTMEQFLNRPIRVSFEQEPIEVALQLVADEANDNLPAGTPQLEFQLDGDAFEKAGITRNQQLREFSIDNASVRSALTEIAKRGNPVTTVTDLSQSDQKLIWLVDSTNGGQPVIKLSTRVAAQSQGIELPAEFSASK